MWTVCIFADLSLSRSLQAKSLSAKWLIGIIKSISVRHVLDRSGETCLHRTKTLFRSLCTAASSARFMHNAAARDEQNTDVGYWSAKKFRSKLLFLYILVSLHLPLLIERRVVVNSTTTFILPWIFHYLLLFCILCAINCVYFGMTSLSVKKRGAS